MAGGETADLVIIGGGPAGLSAAIEARRGGVESVVVLDEGPAPGGQIFRRYSSGFAVTDAHAAGHEYTDGERLIAEARASGAEIRSQTMVWGVWDKRIAFVAEGERAGVIDARALIVAPGARDRPVAFPGWTLPGVITAGAAKIMVAIQRVLPGRRILVAGSGPLALAFSAQLRGYGANIVEVAEAAPRPGFGAFLRLVRSGEASILRDAALYRLRLMRDRVPLSHSTILVRAVGGEQVEGAVLARVDRDWRPVRGSEREVTVDTIIVGYGLETSSELFRLMGCRLRFDRNLGGWLPLKDAWTRTSLPGIYAAGDGSGVGGSRYALTEGRISGITAACHLGALTKHAADARAAPFVARLQRLAAFRDALNAIYRVGPGLFELATPDTIVCRCEGGRAHDLEALIEEGIIDPNIVRARSRIGMGRCQGRNCASHVAATIARLRGIEVENVPPLSARPPVKPMRISAIAEEREQLEATVEVR